MDSGIVASKIADVFRAYLECSDETKEAIRDLIDITNDPDATRDEVAMATLNLAGEDADTSGRFGPDQNSAAVASTRKELLRFLVKSLREARHQRRHDGFGHAIVSVDVYQNTALLACDEIERLQEEEDRRRDKARPCPAEDTQ